MLKNEQIENKTLIIWLKGGNTLKFEQVKSFNEHSDSITFSYFGVATHVRRMARFIADNMTGYALED